MARAKALRMGVESPSPPPDERRERVMVLRATVEEYLPNFADAIVRYAAEPEEDRTIMLAHQASFAAGYDDDEYTLLGMAVKYAGLYGVRVMFTGKNPGTS
jgi:hypothetical protein